MVGVPHQNGCKLEKSVNHYWVHHLNVIETQSEQKYDWNMERFSMSNRHEVIVMDN